MADPIICPVVVPSPYPGIVIYARAIQKAIQGHPWQTTVSPITSIIAQAPGEMPSTLAPLIHPLMVDIPAGLDASNVRPIHVAAMLSAWDWFVVLVPSSAEAPPKANPCLAVLLDGHTPKQVPSLFSLTEELDQLIQVSLPVDLYAVDSADWSVLHWAVFGDAAEWLCAAKQRPHDPNAFTPRYTDHIYRNHITLFKELANHRCSRIGFTPFDIAVVLDAIPTMIFYIRNNLIPAGTDHALRTPLHLARSPESIRLLLTLAPKHSVRTWYGTWDALGGPPWIHALSSPHPADCISMWKETCAKVGLALPTLADPKICNMARFIIQKRLENGEIVQCEADSTLSLLGEAGPPRDATVLRERSSFENTVPLSQAGSSDILMEGTLT